MSETVIHQGYEFKRLQSLPHSQGRISLTEYPSGEKKAATYTLHYQLAQVSSPVPTTNTAEKELIIWSFLRHCARCCPIMQRITAKCLICGGFAFESDRLVLNSHAL